MKFSMTLCASIVAILAATTSAFATRDPIPGIDIIVDCPHCKPPIEAITAHTNGNGEVTLKGLVPGDYVAVIDGKSLVAAVDRMGGGGGHSHLYKEKEGAEPTKGSNDSSRSANVAAGDVNGDGPPQKGSIVLNLPWSAGDKVSAPYHRDSALREGVRIKFTVPSSSEGATYDALGRIIFVGVTVKY